MHWVFVEFINLSQFDMLPFIDDDLTFNSTYSEVVIFLQARWMHKTYACFNVSKEGDCLVCLCYCFLKRFQVVKPNKSTSWSTKEEA